MKIAIIVSGGVDRSGVYRVVPCLLWLIERLVRAGDEVHVFAVCQDPQPGSWPLLGATIHNAGNSLWRLLLQIAAEHRRGCFDVSHALWSAPANLAALLAKYLLGVPMLLYFGGGELSSLPDIGYGSLRSRKGRLFLRCCVAGASHIAAQSQPLVARAATMNIRAERMALGVALDQWPQAAPRPLDPSKPVRLLHVGSLNGVKDHAMLLRAAAALKARNIAFELSLIGADTFADQRVQAMARRLGLDAQVRFHGFVPHHRLRDFFDQADFLLVTSRQEAGPVVALEAAIAGVAVVGTDVGHLSEWSPQGARVVSSGDSEGLAEAIIGLLADETARIGLATQAQRRALLENADVTSARFRRVYAGLAGRSAAL